MAKVWYSVPWDLERDADPHRYEAEVSEDLSEPIWRDLIAQQCADDYHCNQDGWEASWPLVFLLYESEDGPEVCRFSVEREYEPCFHAYEVQGSP